MAVDDKDATFWVCKLDVGSPVVLTIDIGSVRSLEHAEIGGGGSQQKASRLTYQWTVSTGQRSIPRIQTLLNHWLCRWVISMQHKHAW